MASGRGVVVATVFPTAASSPPPVLLLPGRCALCCITLFRCLVSPVNWMRGGGGPSTFVLRGPTCIPSVVTFVSTGGSPFVPGGGSRLRTSEHPVIDPQCVRF
jgi:hypothetical protein